MELRVPGDKSISQRALILGALARGESRVRGLLAGEDPRATAGAMRALGAEIPPLPPHGQEIRIRGPGLRDLRAPSGTLDLANSGTGARLLLGVLAGQPLDVVMTGDASLRARPMGRVTEPLTAMGARFEALEAEDRLPLRIRGGALRPLTYDLPVASAQVKSALLLAGLVGGVPVTLTEPGRSRDHTERMFRDCGVPVHSREEGKGRRVVLPPPPARLEPLDLQVPGDFSSAAFFLVLALLGGVTEPLVLKDVCLNPTRAGLLPVLERMGGRVRVENRRGGDPGEPLGDLVAEPSELRGCEVGEDEIPLLLDEVPVLAVAGALARGTTRITGARELRVKETDRLRALARNLQTLGVDVREMEDGLEIRGRGRAPDGPSGGLRGRVESFGDHRIAMAFGVLGALPGHEVEVEGREVVGVSFPGFWEELRRVSGMAPEGRVRGGGGPRDPDATSASRPPVITLDGPAGSGKSTTAREVARRLGFRHLDSGALYRALTFALLDADVPAETWSELSREELDRFSIRLRPTPTDFQVVVGERVLDRELRSREVTAGASPLSAVPAVRSWLLDLQREAGREGGLVADGRDMGTVVFPDAELKVYLTASLEERARRRFLEREGRPPGPGELEREMEEIRTRDSQDSRRAVAPLKKPPGALEVDTSHITFQAQVEAILRHTRALTRS